MLKKAGIINGTNEFNANNAILKISKNESIVSPYLNEGIKGLFTDRKSVV
jgi:hypothetical protein